MLIEELQKLKTEGEPQNMEELFSQSKEGMMMEKIRMGMEQMRMTMMGEMMAAHKEMMGRMQTQIISELKGSIRDGRDGNDGKPGEDADEGRITKLVLAKIAPSLKKKEVLEVDGVKGLRKILNDFSTRITSVGSRRGGGGGGGDTIIADDLSSQCDGSTTAFTTTKRIGKPILVVSSQFPTVLRLTTDFTASNQTLTLNAALDAIQSGQTLYFVYSEG